jgi:hypothetical protein
LPHPALGTAARPPLSGPPSLPGTTALAPLLIVVPALAIDPLAEVPLVPAWVPLPPVPLAEPLLATPLGAAPLLVDGLPVTAFPAPLPLLALM